MPFGPLPHQDLRMEDPQLKPANRLLIIHQSGNIDLVALFTFYYCNWFKHCYKHRSKMAVTEQMVVKAQAEKAHANSPF